jgi:hypothetical protein
MWTDIRLVRDADSEILKPEFSNDCNKCTQHLKESDVGLVLRISIFLAARTPLQNLTNSVGPFHKIISTRGLATLKHELCTTERNHTVRKW